MSMDIKEIQNLIKFVSKSGVNEVSIEQGEFKITIKSDTQSGEQIIMQQPLAVQSVPVTSPALVQAPTETVQTSTTSETKEESNYVTIKSPMIGTFYRRPSPDKDIFVNVGDSINEGDVICIVEAMKLFNEIEAEISGTIVKVLVDDTSPIEYDQPLFLVDPA